MPASCLPRGRAHLRCAAIHMMPDFQSSMVLAGCFNCSVVDSKSTSRGPRLAKKCAAAFKQLTKSMWAGPTSGQAGFECFPPHPAAGTVCPCWAMLRVAFPKAPHAKDGQSCWRKPVDLPRQSISIICVAGMATPAEEPVLHKVLSSFCFPHKEILPWEACVEPLGGCQRREFSTSFVHVLII